MLKCVLYGAGISAFRAVRWWQEVRAHAGDRLFASLSLSASLSASSAASVLSFILGTTAELATRQQAEAQLAKALDEKRQRERKAVSLGLPADSSWAWIAEVTETETETERARLS